MAYYPDQRYVSPYTIIRRECVLPEEASGQVRIMEGKRVDERDVVLDGIMPSRHVIIDAMPILGLKKPSELPDLMQVEIGDVVEDQDVIAGKSLKRGKRVYSPIRGIVAYINNGRIIMQEMPQRIEVLAGVRGRVSQVKPGRSMTIEAKGALVQGVWGNNRRTIATLRLEPEGGMLNIEDDDLDLRYKGVVVVTQSTLQPQAFEVILERGLVGVIAPSMDYSMVPLALQSNAAILLTEGFGSARMSRNVYTIFEQFNERQITLDAYMPNRWESRAPEVIVNITSRDADPSRPDAMQRLRTNMSVRVTREPYAGQTAHVVELPKLPIQLSNGLRVPCARVELSTGETVIVPLANLEFLGR